MRSHLPPWIHSAARRLLRPAAMLLTYAGVFLAYRYLSRYSFIEFPIPFDPRGLLAFGTDPEQIGFFLQITIVPLLLFFLLSYVPYFRELLQDQTSPHGTLRVFLGLAAVQLVSQTYEIYVSRTTGQPFFIGTFVIFLGSLIGGWRIGLLLGGISLAYQGIFELATMSPMISDIRTMGIVKYVGGLYWTRYVFSHAVNPHFSGGVWTAVFACLAADWLGLRRFSPLAASVLGAVLVYAVGDLRYAAGIMGIAYNVPAQALVTGFAVALAMLMLRTLQVEAERRKAAESDLARTQAELRTLRAQINPHFFFNALNTIRYMIREDPQNARDLLIDLSGIFQRTLRSGDFVPLRDELEYVESYFSLEKARLGDRLRIDWGGVLYSDCPAETDSPLLDCLVPTLALQPIVENAVIHGVGRKKEGGTVSVSVDRRDDDLILVVADDGTGMDAGRRADLLPSDGSRGGGIGLKNVNARLRMLYGPEYGLAIDSEPGKGTRVTLRVPMRTAGEKK